MLILDEFSDASHEMRRECRKLLQGDPDILVEGERIPIRPVPVVLFNDHSDPSSLLSDAVYRRSFAMDTGTVKPAMKAFEQGFRDFYTAQGHPRFIDLDDVEPTDVALPSAASELLNVPRGDHSVLTEIGKKYWDLPKLDLCALGRAKRWGHLSDGDPVAAAACVMLDALCCAETIPGWVRPDWRQWFARPAEWARFFAGRPGGEHFLAVAQRGQEAQTATRGRVDAVRRQSVEVELRLTRQRGEFKQTLRDLRGSITQVPAPYRPEAQGLRDALKGLIDRAGDTRSIQGLDDLDVVAQPIVSDAQALRQRIDDEKAAAIESDAELDRQEKAAKLFAAEEKDRIGHENARANHQRTTALTKLRAWRRACIRLQGRKRAKSPLEVQEALVTAGAARREVSFRQVEELPTPIEALAAKIARRPIEPRIRTVQDTWYRDITGGWWRPGQLQAWTDPAVKQVLTLAVDEIDRLIGMVESRAVGSIAIAQSALPVGQWS
ncbi:MAG TPA: hypothetical protein VNV87_11225 [Acidimicrobiales bacterium]|nr:hypothetical protein [Acidimicrobiales bacterium]